MENILLQNMHFLQRTTSCSSYQVMQYEYENLRSFIPMKQFDCKYTLLLSYDVKVYYYSYRYIILQHICTKCPKR